MSAPNTTQQGDVLSAIERGIATVEFSHPASNSLPGRILQKLAYAITEAGKHPEAKVIILKSRGDRAFCAGASFEELASISDEAAGKEFFSGFAKVINAARKCPRLIIGRAQGKAVGGGVGMIAATDVCYATKHAAIRLSELALGIGPFVVGPAVERKVGKSAFVRLSITPEEWYDAEWARQHDLYAEVFETTEELDSAVQKSAETLASYSPQAMAQLKQVFWEGTAHWDELLAERAAMSGKLVLSEFTRKAIKAFKQK